MRTKHSLLSAIPASLLLAACASGGGSAGGPNGTRPGGARGTMTGPAFNANVPPKPVEMRDLDGRSLGTLTLTQAPYGLVISGDLTGLPPGPHALHFHDVGICTPPFTTAGGHYNPTGRSHGIRNRVGYHAGDLPNFVAPASGPAHVELFTRDVSIAPSTTTLYDFDGSSLVIHGGADDYQSDPAGNSGTRIACGAIVRDSTARDSSGARRTR